jgi:NAD(P)-dependent dehydrogenase (short-subunit alcohol dehydrogenase family)
METRKLEGQVALVTGGGKGMGRAIALALAARGVRVVVTGRDERALGETVGEIAFGGGKARHLAGDVRDVVHLRAAVARAIESFGGLDIVVANAGISGRTPIEEDAARAEAIVQTNLMGTFYTFHAALPAMKGPSGRLLAVSSVLAKFGVPGYAAYCASKAGILGLVRALAHECAPRKITANALVPGWVETQMAEDGLREIAAGTGRSRDEVKADALKVFPLGRFLEPEEVAALAVFLCSSEAAGITGQAISICGGATAFGG